MLTSDLEKQEIFDFFLVRYAPTPILSPWNGDGGFFPDSRPAGRQALAAIEKSDAGRYSEYRKAIAAVRTAIGEIGLKSCPEKGKEKDRLLLACRNRLPDAALHWIDACVALTGNGAKFPPLLGTGGNDGSMDFSNNHMQWLVKLLGVMDDGASTIAQDLLEASIFGTSCAGLPNSSFGQFSPAESGWVNATSGFVSRGTINPWDAVLALEGAVTFASAASKSLESTGPGQLVFPFCVQPSASGYGSSSTTDEDDSRCEIWLPIWRTPSSIDEISNIFSEGRSWVGRRPARNGLDFALAVSSLGVDRGIDEFQRYSFQKRKGKSYYATPLQRLKVRRNSVAADLLAECDTWIQRFSVEAKATTAPHSIQRAYRRLEAAILAQCAASQAKNPGITQELLLALGDCERSLATACTWAAKHHIRPIPPLSPNWISAAETDIAEYRLAASLGSLKLWVNKQFNPMRRNLEPVRFGPGFPARAEWDDEAGAEVVSSEGSVTDFLIALMRKRLLLAQSTSPESWPEFAHISAYPSDVAKFIEGRIDEALFIRLLWGLCLIGFPKEWRGGLLRSRPKSDFVPSAFYAQLKLCFAKLPGEKDVPVSPAIFNLAASGDGERASAQALRRLHGSSIPITHVRINLSGEAVRRSAAALLFPLWDNQLRSACESVAPSLFAAPIND